MSSPLVPPAPSAPPTSPAPTTETRDRALGGTAWSTAASRALHPSARPDADGWLWAVASGLASVTVPWELRPGPAPSERVWERVLATPTYEVWVIGWPPGTGLDLHDHGASAGAFCVAGGELVEVVPAPAGGLERRRWAAGQGALFGPGVVHQVTNEATAMATSVHVYSPGLSAMTFYGADGRPVADGGGRR